MLVSLFFYFLYFVAAITVFLTVYKAVTKPEIKKSNGVTKIYYDKRPSPLDFYIRLIFAWNNLVKASKLSNKTKIPRFECYGRDNSFATDNLNKYIAITGYDKNAKEAPLTLHFSVSLPYASSILTDSAFPLKAMSGIVHVKQTCFLLRPILKSEKISVRGVVEGGENTDRGSEITFTVELYASSTFEASSIIAQGDSTMLIPSRRKGNAETTPALPPVTRTSTFKVAENTGRRYAAGSGDYNPWHLWPQTAKIFGFRRAIAQGFWSVNKCLAEIGNDLPEYPLKMEVEWKKPLFMPSTVTLTIRAAEDKKKVVFELTSEDKQHVHLVGSVEHIPSMKLTPV